MHYELIKIVSRSKEFFRHDRPFSNAQNLTVTAHFRKYEDSEVLHKLLLSHLDLNQQLLCAQDPCVHDILFESNEVALLLKMHLSCRYK